MQYSVICPVDSLFKMANNTVLRGGYIITVGVVFLYTVARKIKGLTCLT